MVTINTLHIDPPLLNSSCAWASEETQLRDLFDCEFTGAITTRTATLTGFKENSAVHTVAFSRETISSVNSYGYSPHSLSRYLAWIESLLASPSSKAIIISITASDPVDILRMVNDIQSLRKKLSDMSKESSNIGVELNTSCPNIEGAPPIAYNPELLKPFLHVVNTVCASDPSLTFGLKLPPYVHAQQFVDVLRVISEETLEDSHGVRTGCVSFLTCTNTLGTSLLFEEQTSSVNPNIQNSFALPTPLGGLAGEALHALSLGNVYSFSRLITASKDPLIKRISIIGVGGVTCSDAVKRMHAAGAIAVGCATLLGKHGIRAFEALTI